MNNIFCQLWQSVNEKRPKMADLNINLIISKLFLTPRTIFCFNLKSEVVFEGREMTA